MKKLFFVCFVCLFSNVSFAQFGINAGLRVNGETSWQYFTNKDDFLKTGYKVGIDYWFRLKKVRVEFTPELNFSQFKDDYTSSIDDKYTFKNNVYGLHLNTNIYPLNFKDDCNCPTFKKDGQVIEKGFHIILSPGVNYFEMSINEDSYKTNDVVVSAGLGVGLDIGLTDYLTITPLAMYHHYFNAEWEDLDKALDYVDDIPANASTSTSINQFFFGVRMSIRLDEMKNKYGYR
jgi:opacity protein-like surface antigen